MPSPDPNAEAAELEQAVERTSRYSGSNRDFALLADAYLRLKPEYDALRQRVAELEDETPVDRDFIDSVTFGETAYGFLVSNSDTETDPDKYVAMTFSEEADGEWVCEISDGSGETVVVGVKSRSQVRQLLAALGIGR